MSAQASGSAGGNDKKLSRASKCDNCGNCHEGPCLPKCSTCGKVHKGICRYAKPVPAVESVGAPRQPSQEELTARFNAQQVGYQQAYNEMRSSGMGPGMPPGMGGQSFGPAGGFGSQYPGQYGGLGGFGGFGSLTINLGNPGWANPVPGQFNLGYGGFPAPPMGPGYVAPFGNVGYPTSIPGGIQQGAGDWHEAQKKIRGLKDSRKPRGKEQSKDKKGEKGPLAAKHAWIEKPISKNARARANKKAKEQRKKEEAKKDEEKLVQDALSGPADPELLALLADSKVQKPSHVETALAREEDMEDIAPPAGDAEVDLGLINAESLIWEAENTPVGFQFPRDNARVVRMAHLLVTSGQERLLNLSEAAGTNSTSIIWEAYQQDLYDEQLADMAAGVPLPRPINEEDEL